MLTHEQLKACPFCGGPGKAVAFPAGCFYVQCGTCGMGGSASDTPEIAATAWNARAAEIDLRDYFAAKVMQGRLSAGCNDDGDYSGMEAVICYQIADAMLAEREKRHE